MYQHDDNKTEINGQDETTEERHQRTTTNDNNDDETRDTDEQRQHQEYFWNDRITTERAATEGTDCARHSSGSAVRNEEPLLPIQAGETQGTGTAHLRSNWGVVREGQYRNDPSYIYGILAKFDSNACFCPAHGIHLCEGISNYAPRREEGPAVEQRLHPSTRTMRSIHDSEELERDTPARTSGYSSERRPGASVDRRSLDSRATCHLPNVHHSGSAYGPAQDDHYPTSVHRGQDQTSHFATSFGEFQIGPSVEENFLKVDRGQGCQGDEDFMEARIWTQHGKLRQGIRRPSKVYSNELPTTNAVLNSTCRNQHFSRQMVDGGYRTGHHRPCGEERPGSHHTESLCSSDAATQERTTLVRHVFFLTQHLELERTLTARIRRINELTLNNITEPEDEIDINFLSGSSNGVNTQIDINGERIIVRRISARCDLPLAEVTTPGFCFLTLKSYFTRCEPESDLLLLLSWINEPDMARTLLQNNEAISMSDSRLTQSLTQYLENGSISTGSARFEAPVFAVEKSDGEHSRLIYNGKNFDRMFQNAFGKPPPMPIPDIQIIIRALLDPRWRTLATNDGKTMFCQYAIHPLLSQCLGFRVSGQSYTMSSLPMGICIAPAWAQHVSNYILAILASKLSEISSHYVSFAWVDNFIFAATSEEIMERVKEKFEVVCEELQVVLKRWEGGDSLKILGLFFKIEEGGNSCSPSTESTQRLGESWRRLQSLTTTGRRFLTWFGLIGWISYTVARIPMCYYPSIMKTLRGVCRTGRWDEVLQVTPMLVEEGNQLMKLVSAAMRWHEIVDTNLVTAFTDASMQYIGAVSFETGLAVSIRADISQRKINVGEMIAAALLGDIVATNTTSYRNWMWVGDNTAALWAFVKGHSTNSLGDSILNWWIRKGSTPKAVLWAKSVDNSSDPFTRVCCGQASAVATTLDEGMSSKCIQYPRWLIPVLR